MNNKKCWSVAESLLSVLGGTESTRFLFLWGPAGTGKTFAASKTGLREEQQSISVTITDETAAADLLGYYINAGPAGFIWQDGPAARAWRTGARLVLNEIDHANGDLTALLHVICDNTASASLALVTGETLTPHPRFVAVATSNASPEDALRTEGMRSRFSARVHINTPHEALIATLPMELQEIARSTSVHAEEDQRISMRAWRTFVDIRESLSWETAAFVVFGENRHQAVLDSLKIAQAKI